MKDLVLLAVGIGVPLAIALFVYLLTRRHLRAAVMRFTGEDSTGRLCSRMFACTVILGSIVYPIADHRACGLGQLLDNMGPALGILVLCLFGNLFAMAILLGALGKKSGSNQ